MAKKRKPKVEGTFTITMNGHTLHGEKRDGGWTFTCASWPTIAQCSGDDALSVAIEEFMSNCLYKT